MWTDKSSQDPTGTAKPLAGSSLQQGTNLRLSLGITCLGDYVGNVLKLLCARLAGLGADPDPGRIGDLAVVLTFVAWRTDR
jgi:hypothetical protein